MIPYDVQIIGGIVLHQGKIAEMKTGEGKTLVCTMPVYLNALTGDGVFVVTVNEYLAERDAEWMSGMYQFLGLSVGTILHAQNPEQKQEIYRRDIIYGTNNEFGFDYLRDNMAVSLENIVQRNLNYAIIDEVDSILIDEARTPLIISAPAEESTAKYQRYSRLIQNLVENEDYNIDEKIKTATLTEAGIAKIEKLMGVENIYTEAGFLEVHHLEQALKATACYKRDVDYMVKDDEVIIVDEFTGRLMPGRRYSEGLHQAIEAKEGVEVKRESKTLATVSLQNYFRLFKKLGGMTGTAMTEAEEFYKIYRLDTVEIPTNVHCIRKDQPDVIYKTMKAKFLAVTEKVKELHDKGQPVLIGTISIEKSEMLSQLLSMKGVPHNVLNAKHHAREAEIVANAGQKGAVTIATNMAGRGTDIKLGEGVREIGGLYIIGTERHESRRIDNQLRGRSGRQGDLGESRFYVSLEDELMRLFGSEKIQKMMDKLGIPDEMPIENSMISNSIESAQKRVEGRNFDIRKHLVDYDDVMNKHREIIYSRRRKMLKNTDTQKDIAETLSEEAKNIVLLHTSFENRLEWNIKEIVETVKTIHIDAKNPITEEELLKMETREEIIEKTAEYLAKEYEEREKEIEDPMLMRDIERNVCLHVIDSLWMEHIDEMSHLRENVALQGYGQRDPLIEYKSEAFTMLAHLLSAIRSNTINTLFKVDLEKEAARKLLIQTAREMQTNENEIEGVLSGEKSATGTHPTIIRVSADENSSGSQAIWATGGSGTPLSHAKAGRNDPCPCGSGKKYKKCHRK
ncbi:preprotein translocase subunit SecA, partial [Candidatus Peregrinibacteria bacterium]|nr:preprotein translocase subunit SecA [Candidatus Peregrinibacteria bacterium]